MDDKKKNVNVCEVFMLELQHDSYCQVAGLELGPLVELCRNTLHSKVAGLCPGQSCEETSRCRQERNDTQKTGTPRKSFSLVLC